MVRVVFIDVFYDLEYTHIKTISHNFNFSKGWGGGGEGEGGKEENEGNTV